MFDVWNPEFGLRKHAGLSEYKTALPSDLYARLLKFAVVRNPWNRMLSVYYAPNRVAAGKVNPSEPLNVSEFLRLVRAQRTFREFVTTDLASHLQDELDRVLLFERLERGLDELTSDLGLPRLSMGRGNASPRPKNYRSAYNAEMREAVRDKFGEEIRAFGYTF